MSELFAHLGMFRPRSRTQAYLAMHSAVFVPEIEPIEPPKRTRKSERSNSFRNTGE